MKGKIHVGKKKNDHLKSLYTQVGRNSIQINKALAESTKDIDVVREMIARVEV